MGRIRSYINECGNEIFEHSFKITDEDIKLFFQNKGGAIEIDEFETEQLEKIRWIVGQAHCFLKDHAIKTNKLLGLDNEEQISIIENLSFTDTMRMNDFNMMMMNMASLMKKSKQCFYGAIVSIAVLFIIRILGHLDHWQLGVGIALACAMMVHGHLKYTQEVVKVHGELKQDRLYQQIYPELDLISGM